MPDTIQDKITRFLPIELLLNEIEEYLKKSSLSTKENDKHKKKFISIIND